MKENAKHHITSLERLYDDRVHLLQEQQRSFGKESAMGTDAAKRNVRNIKNASRESSGLNHKHMVLRQQRERMLLQRQEALKKLNDLNHMLLTSNVNANSLRSKSNPQANNKGKKSLQRRDYVRRSSRDRPTRPDPSNLNTIRTINDQNYYYNNIDSTTIPTSTTSYSADIDNSNTTLTPTTSISSGSSIDSLPFNDYQYEPVDTNVFDMINNINSNIAQKDLEMGYSDAAELNVLDGLDSMGLHSSTNGNISGSGNRYDDVEYPEPGPDDASDELNGSDSFNGSSDSTPNMLHSQ